MECSIKGVKSNQAMKNYKRAKFLYNFVLYLVISFVTCLLLSLPFWFPFVKQFLSTLPNMSLFLNAKCFFIVGNLIIIILIGESKLKHSSHSSASDIYKEYSTRSRTNSTYRKVKSMQNLNVEGESHGSEEKVYLEEKKKDMKKSKSSTMLHEEKKKEMRVCKSEVWGESEHKITKGKKEEDHHIPREELNKRVEAFIARVNKQRLLEAKLVDNSRS